MKTSRVHSGLVGLGWGYLALTIAATTFPELLPLPTAQVETHMARVNAAAPLAAQLRGKPVVVKISADWCSTCKGLRPVISGLEQQYAGQVTFVTFDVTNRSTVQAAEARARELGLTEFFSTRRTQTSTIAVINPNNGQVVRLFRNNRNAQDYRNAIDSTIAQLQR